jgi:DNA-binding PadR family transcriptional regulator
MRASHDALAKALGLETPETIPSALQRLIDAGLIEWTGEYQDGRATWYLTDKGIETYLAEKEAAGGQVIS